MGDWCESHQVFNNLKDETTGANRRPNDAVLDRHAGMLPRKNFFAKIFQGRGALFS
jgi:hypothetical protein